MKNVFLAVCLFVTSVSGVAMAQEISVQADITVHLLRHHHRQDIIHPTMDLHLLHRITARNIRDLEIQGRDTDPGRSLEVVAPHKPTLKDVGFFASSTALIRAQRGPSVHERAEFRPSWPELNNAGRGS